MRHARLTLCAALVALFPFACGQDGGSANPVAPETADLSVATDSAQQPQTLLCHWSPDYLEEGEPFEYTVLSVNGNAVPGHAQHGDPLSCDLATLGLVAGEDCSACAQAAPPVDPAPQPTPPAGVPQGKARICHFDVDDEELYDSIVIEISSSAYSKHLANHGDCDSVDPVGTENCTCAL